MLLRENQKTKTITNYQLRITIGFIQQFFLIKLTIN